MTHFNPRNGLIYTMAMLLCALMGCPSQPTQKTTKTVAQKVQPTPPKMETRQATTPKRIILLIGDGMGLPVVTASAYANGGLNMLKMPVISYMRTHEYEYLTTDSAASATAFATGEKTHFEGVSVKPGTTKAQETNHDHHFAHMVEVAKKAGLRTGLVATSRIVHATPAAFASHRQNRKSYEDIALDMSLSGVDVLLGAGTKYFQKRKDGKDLLAQMQQAGYEVAKTPEAIGELSKKGDTKKLVGLLYDKDMPPLKKEARKMSLAQMLTHSIEVLDRDNDKGFFLMVEGSQIDWEEHALNGKAAIKETIDFDAAVGRALLYASGRKDTLVVVTADHETGGFAVLDPGAIRSPLKVLGQGSMEKVNALAATTFKGNTKPEPDALQAVPLADPKTFGPSEIDKPHLITNFGYMSMASRTLWKKDSGFISSHTNTMVPLFAKGAGQELVRDVSDNADLGRLLQSMIQKQAQPTMAYQRPTFANKRPKNVILLVGDGMGLAPVTAAYYVQGKLSMLEAPYKGLVSTHATNRVVNDSAATATALSTGQRTRYGSVGMVPKAGKLQPATTVLEAAELNGLRTGLVTTTTLTHATPAAFYAHQASRRAEGDIAKDFVSLPSRVVGSNGVDIALGGGRKYFTPALLKKLKSRNVQVETTWNKHNLKPNEQLLGLYDARGLKTALTRHTDNKQQTPTLAQMTKRAIDHLAHSPKGFFLMVEGGQIDWAQHALDKGKIFIPEMVDFDQAVEVAMTYAKTHGDTLVIVTADHDHTMSLLDNHYAFHRGWCGVAKRCGGSFAFEPINLSTSKTHRRDGFAQTALQGTFGAPELIIQYAWLPQHTRSVVKHAGPHSAHFVPLMSYGPGAQAFSGFMDQPQVGTQLLLWASGAKQ